MSSTEPSLIKDNNVSDIIIKKPDSDVMLEFKPRTSEYIKNKYKPVKKLGSGTFGEVWQASLIAGGGRDVAIKFSLAYFNETEGIETSALNEISLLKRFKHPNIVSIIEVDVAILQEKHVMVAIVLELAQNSIFNLLKDEEDADDPINHTDKILPFSTVLNYTYQMFSALNYLHQQSIMHLDLKPHNLLHGLDGQLKLCDFGLSNRTITIHSAGLYRITVAYREPGMQCNSRDYDSSADIWSAGVIVFELFFGFNPFAAKNNLEASLQFQKYLNKIGIPSKSWQDRFISSYSKCIIDSDAISQEALVDIKKKLAAEPEVTRYHNLEQTLFQSPTQRDHFKELYGEQVFNNIMTLVQTSLRFEPEQRITAQQALSHALFAECNQSSTEHKQDISTMIAKPIDNSRTLHPLIQKIIKESFPNHDTILISYALDIVKRLEQIGGVGLPKSLMKEIRIKHEKDIKSYGQEKAPSEISYVNLSIEAVVVTMIAKIIVFSMDEIIDLRLEFRQRVPHYISFLEFNLLENSICVALNWRLD